MSVRHLHNVGVAEIRTMTTSETPADLLDAVRGMLDEAFSGSFSDDDWEHALGGHHVVMTDEGEVVAHASVVPRQLTIGDDVLRCGYVEAVATRPSLERRGHATTAMRVINRIIADRYELGVLSTGAHGFYERVGWQRWTGPSYVVETDGSLHPTPDEDDGIMVLAVKRTFEQSSPIECEARLGDDW